MTTQVSPSRSRAPGEHLFTWYVEGREGQTYGFFFEEPEGGGLDLAYNEDDDFTAGGHRAQSAVR